MKKKIFSTFRFETKFKIEFLDPLTGPRNPLTKILHILSISLPNFILRNNIIRLKTKFLLASRNNKQNENEKEINPKAEPLTAQAKGKINWT